MECVACGRYCVIISLYRILLLVIVTKMKDYWTSQMVT